MRILPQDYRGHHAAFPKYPDNPLTGFCNLIPTSALLALPFAGVSALLRRPHPWALATKAAAYFAATSTVCTALVNESQDRVARVFLRTEGIELPRRRLLDLNGRFELDDAVISGGLIGVLVATLRKGPASVRGWKRYFGSFAFGGGCGLINLLAFHSYKWTRDPKERSAALACKQRSQEIKAEEVKWHPLVIRTFRNQLSEATQRAAQRAAQPASQQNTMPPTPENDNLNARRTSPTAGSTGESSGPQGGGSGPIGITLVAQDEPDGRDDPHLTRLQGGSSKPVHVPVTNYDWTSKQEIEDLEKHLHQLRERRERLARESEFMWAWLAEKEAEFYNNDVKNDPNAKRDLHHYLLALAESQRATWEEVSMTDWMIADTKKRMEQRRSASSDQESKVTWRPGCSEAAAKTPPTFALERLRVLQAEIGKLKWQIEQAKAQAIMAMADPMWELKANAQVYDPEKKKMVSEKEAFLEARKGLDEHLEEVTATYNAMKQMLVEGEAMAKECEKEG